MFRQRRWIIFLGLVTTIDLAIATNFAAAQSSATYTARLSWVPVSLRELNLVGGQGSAKATLVRDHLVVDGAFDGIPTEATSAKLHYGAATGASGPAIADLEIVAATAGSISGDIRLSRDQRAALLAGLLYIQVYSDNGVPPDNAVLRGWLLSDRQ